MSAHATFLACDFVTLDPTDPIGLSTKNAVFTPRGCRGEIDAHTSHHVFASHVDNGIGVAVPKAPVPSFEVQGVGGIMCSRWGRDGLGVSSA